MSNGKLRDPWKEKYFGPTEVVRQKFHVKTDNKTRNVNAETEKHARELMSQHFPDEKILSVTNKGYLFAKGGKVKTDQNKSGGKNNW